MMEVKLKSILPLCHHVRVFAFAVKVYWDSGGLFWHPLSTVLWYVVAQSFQIML
jgi:hypothetical protein